MDWFECPLRPRPFGKGPSQRWKRGHRGPSCLHRFDFQPLRPAVSAAQRCDLCDFCIPKLASVEQLYRLYKHQSRNGFTTLRMFAIVSLKSILQGPVPMSLRSLICDVVEPGVELNAAPRDIVASSKYSHDSMTLTANKNINRYKQWIGLREHLQETTLRIDVFQREWCFPAGARFQDSMNQKKPWRNMQWSGSRALMLVGINPR